MENFIFKNATEIRFGSGVLSELGQVVNDYGKKALFVYGMNSIKTNGLYDLVTQELQQQSIDIVEFGGVRSNPTLSHTYEGIDKAIEHGVDVIVAVGGGSVIDEAKAISIGAVGTDPWPVLKREQVITNSLPIISVQTLPATASEMNGGFVLSNDETNEKFGTGGSEATHPKVSFLDPSYTTSISLKQTAYSVADILSHLTEGYFTNTAVPGVTHYYIEAIAKSVIESMRSLLKNPEDLDARGSLMWASSLGWNGIGKLGLKDNCLPCHALEHAMSGIYPQIAHGAGLAVITPAWLTYHQDTYQDSILRFGQNVLGLNVTEPSVVIKELIALYQEIGAPTTWDELEVVPDYAGLTTEARKLFDAWGITKPANTDDDIKAIYQMAESSGRE